MPRASLDKDPAEVAQMFDRVAPRYDVTNDVLSAGQTYLWRRAVLKSADTAAGERVLDIAAGTGTSSAGFAHRQVEVVPADFSLGMLKQGRRKRPDMPFTAADALRLPFADDSFDVVTMSFGLRNVSDVSAALAEFARVAKPGGRLVVCEFSQPVWKPMRTAYLQYLMRALPAVASRISSNPESYVYLAESIRAWPAQGELATLISDAGWSSVTWRNLTGGIVALHHAVCPA
ncbi:MAG: demethylmenaquinone methyltransferase [Ornithinimicrobium sp.]